MEVWSALCRKENGRPLCFHFISISLVISLSPSLFISLSLPLSLYIYLSLSLYLSLAISLSLSLYLSLPISVPLSPLSLSLSPSLPLSPPLSPSLYHSLSLPPNCPSIVTYSLQTLLKISSINAFIFWCPISPLLTFSYGQLSIVNWNQFQRKHKKIIIIKIIIIYIYIYIYIYVYTCSRMTTDHTKG